ncbi:MAG: NADH-quinone oxidoreductase subunit L, partial [Halobacteriaceae archaeon]
MVSVETVIYVIVFLPFFGAIGALLLFRYLGERIAYFCASIALVCFLGVLRLGTILKNSGPMQTTVPWIPAFDIAMRFYIDGLALLIALLASGVGILIFVFSRGYMHGESKLQRYYIILLIFMGSMIGIAFAGDLIVLFVFWELTSLSSFGLIGHYTESRSARYAARKSMLITVGGGLFLLVGFLLLGSVVNSYNLVWLLNHSTSVQNALESNNVFTIVVLLIGIGAAAKSAQFPLHIWLPNAMEAPTPVSAFLHSATMVKAGVYLVGRMRPLLLDGGDQWMLLFATLGLVTMTVTALLAVGASDIKELLAYST